MRPFPVKKFLGLCLRVSGQLTVRLFYLGKTMASLAVNYGIYYFRRAVLFQNDQQARKMNDEQYQHYLTRNVNKSQATLGSIESHDVGYIFRKGDLTEEN